MNMSDIANDNKTMMKFYYLICIFVEDINKGVYDILQELYDVCGITNRQLVEQFHRHEFSFTSFDKAVYGDIARLVIYQALEDETVNATFVELMTKRYPKVPKDVSSVLDAYNVDRFDGIEKYKDLVSRYIKNEYSQMTQEFAFQAYLFLDSFFYDEFAKLLPKEITDTRNWLERRLQKETETNDYKLSFYKGELIFDSALYRKYLRKRKEALAAYLGIASEQFQSFFIEAFDDDIREEDLTYEVPAGEPGVVYNNVLAIVQSNFGTSRWVQQITAQKSIRKESLGYRPNVENLMNQYYKKIVFKKYMEYNHNQEPFVQLTLTRECVTDPAKDYTNLLYMYQMDVLYQMFLVEQEEVYRTFSWENVVHRNIAERNDLLVSNLKQSLENRDEAIKALNRELLVLKEQNYKVDNSKSVENLRAFAKLEKELEEKDTETSRLKEQLRIQNEYIEALMEENEDNDALVPVDLQALKEKKYLFVGHIEEAHPNLAHELKRNFPTSAFVENLSDDLSGLQIDGVVYFISFVSHALYYKVRKERKFENLPQVFCSNCNVDKVYEHMSRMRWCEVEN